MANCLRCGAVLYDTKCRCGFDVSAGIRLLGELEKNYTVDDEGVEPFYREPLDETAARQLFEQTGTLIIPQGITEIGEFEYYDCPELIRAVIPPGVRVIGEGAFACCRNLRVVLMPDSVICIEGDPFADCDALEEIIFDGTKEQWEQISWVKQLKDEYEIYGPGAGETDPE